MPYSTVAMVRNALAPGNFEDGNEPYPDGDQTNTAADLSNDQLNDAIAQADATIDSYIGGRYAVPVLYDAGHVLYVLTPAPLNFWSRDIAAYLATLTYRRAQDFADTDPVARRYLNAMLALTGVRDGKAVLQIPENVTDSSEVGVGSPVNPYQGHLFSTNDFDLQPPFSFDLQPGGWLR